MKTSLTLYVVYVADKITAVLRITSDGQTYDEFKYNLPHGITFKQKRGEELPSIYANFKYGTLHGYYFVIVKNSLRDYSDLFDYNLRYAISALYEKGTTEYINCVTFKGGYSLKYNQNIRKYSLSTTKVCDIDMYVNLTNQPKFLNGWSKYGTNYIYYQNGKPIRHIISDNTPCENTPTYKYFIYNDAMTYDYTVKNGITNLDIKINTKKDSITKINPVTKLPVELPNQTIVKYTWYKDQPLILMERLIAPNYCSVTKYRYIKDHNKQLWTNVSINLNKYGAYIDYDSP